MGGGEEREREREGCVAASEEHDKGDGRQREYTVYSSHDTGWEPCFEDEGVPATPATLSFRPWAKGIFP